MARYIYYLDSKSYMKKYIIFLIVIGFCILALVSLLKITSCDSTSDCDLSGNEGTKQVSEVTPSLPQGYTLDSYTIEKVTEVSCNKHSDCKTPFEYLVQSRCPFTSICLAEKCTIVCPDSTTIEFQGEIAKIQPEMDGSILNVKNDDITYEVLVSIPNLGEEFAPSLKDIEVGKYIQVLGTKIKVMDKERIIASQIYIEGTFQGEHPCNLEPDAGSCEAAISRYYFDQEEGKCNEFLWGGCDGTVPFDSLEVCRKTCEKSVPEKPSLTLELCERDGGRVVTPNEDCADNEINIGMLENQTDLICCMITGGSATSMDKNE